MFSRKLISLGESPLSSHSRIEARGTLLYGRSPERAIFFSRSRSSSNSNKVDCLSGHEASWVKSFKSVYLLAEAISTPKQKKVIPDSLPTILAPLFVESQPLAPLAMRAY